MVTATNTHTKSVWGPCFKCAPEMVNTQKRSLAHDNVWDSQQILSARNILLIRTWSNTNQTSGCSMWRHHVDITRSTIHQGLSAYTKSVQGSPTLNPSAFSLTCFECTPGLVNTQKPFLEYDGVWDAGDTLRPRQTSCCPTYILAIKRAAAICLLCSSFLKTRACACIFVLQAVGAREETPRRRVLGVLGVDAPA